MIDQPNPHPPVTSTTTILLLHCCNNAMKTHHSSVVVVVLLLVLLFLLPLSVPAAPRLQKLCNDKRHKEQPAAATTATHTHTRLGEIKDPWNTTTERTYTVHRRADEGGRETRAAPGCSFLAAFGSRFYRGKLVNFVPPSPPR